MVTRDHGDPGDAPSIPPPLTDIADATRPSAAEEARSIAASTNTATLASLTATGDPWASFVTYGLLGGAPVLCVSNMAEHGRNLLGDPRASLAIVAPTTESDPLASGRITLAGVAERPTGDELRAARDAHLAGVAAAKYYIDYSDFTLWVLRVQRVRWVGGYGRMDSATGGRLRRGRAGPGPPARRRCAGPPQRRPCRVPGGDGTGARRLPRRDVAVCTGIDRYGLDLRVDTPRGMGYTRVGFGAPLSSADELRAASVDLVARARRE